MEKINSINKFDILINVGVFNSTLLGIDYPPRGLLHRDSQLDIFKYVLASLSVLKPLLNTIYIYVELEQCFQHQKQELEDYANNLFGTKLNYHNSRNLSQQQWQDTCNKIQSDTIWFLCNHDHFFTQPSLEMLQYCLQTLQQDTHEYKAVHLSHTLELLPAIQENKQNNGLYYMNMSPDSIQIVNKNTLKYWWFNRTYNQTFRRTDERSYSVDIPQGVCYIPPTEICCHYDGYWVPGLYPAYVIPPGFFENNIKIRYGYTDRKENCVNINPSMTNYNDIDPNGTDYKWILEDIPLFWQDKISDIDVNPMSNHNQILNDRNTALLDRLKSRFHKTQYFPARDNYDILDPIIEQYIKQFDSKLNKQSNIVNFKNKHVQPFIDLIHKKQKPSMTVCEIGVLIGETTSKYINIIHNNSGILYVIDNFSGNTGGCSETNSTLENIFLENIQYKYYAKTIKILKMDSNQAHIYIPDKSLDVCFIDADHSYEAVMSDIQLYLPKVKHDGILCGHDIAHNGVKKAVIHWFQDKAKCIIHTNNPNDNNMWQVNIKDLY